MKIGILKLIKIREARIAITPASVQRLTGHDHIACIDKDAGKASGINKGKLNNKNVADMLNIDYTEMKVG